MTEAKQSSKNNDSKIAAVENEFTGTFENYVASIIANWQENKNPKLTQLARSLKDIRRFTDLSRRSNIKSIEQQTKGKAMVDNGDYRTEFRL